MDRSTLSYIFWTCRNRREAKKIICGLFDKRLIACASIFPVVSIYRWKGKIEESREVKVILKTAPEHFDQIQADIQAHCSYQTAEIAQIDSSQTSFQFGSWIAEELSPID